MKQKCAVYCRVSTEGQRDAKNIESQKLELKAYAEKHDWQIHKWYADDGISGAFLLGRAEFQELLEDAQEGNFDILLVSEHSRITRSGDPEERGRILKRLKDCNVKIASPSEGVLDLNLFSGELMTTLKMMFAAEEKEEIRRRMTRGKDKKLANQEWYFRSIAYGYEKETIREAGKPPVHVVKQCPAEANILRMVYDFIVEDHRPLNWIVRFLIDNGYTTRKGTRWTDVKLSSILSNHALMGEFVANKYLFDFGIDPVTGKKKQRYLGVRPESEWKKVKVPIDGGPVFTEAQFKRLRGAIDKNKTKNTETPGAYLLRGKIKCGLCGAGYHSSGSGYYVCANNKKHSLRRKEGETPCKAPWVNAAILDEMVELELMNLLFYPFRSLKKWTNAKAISSQKEQRLKQKLSRVVGDCESKEKEIGNIVAAIVQRQKKHLSESNLRIIDALEAEIETAESDLKRLEQQKADITGKLHEVIDNRVSVESLKRYASKLEKAMYSTKSGKPMPKKLTNEGAQYVAMMRKMIYGMPFEEKRKLIGHFIPAGCRLIIEPLLPDDYFTWKADGLSRKTIVKWDFWREGPLNIEFLIQAVKAYEQTGNIPSYE